MAKKKKTQTRRNTAKKKAAKKKSRPEKSSRAAEAEASAADAPDRFPIVGVGASAGGLKALQALLEAMPDEPGLALVVIQHLDPTKKSLTPDLLGKCTKMQVTQVDDEPHIKPNHVYVLPPDKYLSVSEGLLHLSEPDQPRRSRMAVDFFLRSLAQDCKHRSVGVILSGSGTDGTLGVKAVKAAGGLVIAQDPDTAQFDGMPRSAIDTGAVDHVLPPNEIPDVLVRYAQHPYVREGAAAAPAEEKLHEEKPEPDKGFNSVMALLRTQSKHDFRNYKDKTLIRRTRRRMCLHHIDDYDQYLEYLREHPHEVEALAKDLLITVTDFFREPDAWEALRELAVRPMVEEKDEDEPIRVWTPGCATGEEPYSAAMLILEELKRAKKTCPLNVFASDIDKSALDFAREGRYPQSIQADVSGERLKRFFTTKNGDDDYFYVNKAMRESVVFADQNLISDPPFSKLDLVCCRNLLIYLKPQVQEKIIALFHFALREGGVLFLGSAETIGQQTDLFQTIHKRWRIFRRVGPTRHDRVDIPISKLPHRREIDVQPAPLPRREARLTHLAQQRLLDALAPSAVLIDGKWRILYICGEVDRYLMHKPGLPTDDLLEKARRGLRSKLRVAVQRALSQQRTVSVEARVQRDSAYHPLTVTVRVIRDREQDEDLALVVFEDADTSTTRNRVSPPDESTSTQRKQVSPRDETESDAEEATHSLAHRARMDDDLDDHAVIRQLEDELAATKEDLQATVEQLETSNEEYKASNEEVMSINEELQSTNEELETSKEELQSLNEELSTVNNQLASKVEELESKHADLENLLSATDVATICLDTDLTIRWFTPAVQQVMRLRESDKGRPMADFSHDFQNGDLAKAAAGVLERLTPAEDEAACDDGRVFLRRISPYRADEHRIGGVVITFIEITDRKTAENALAAAKDMAEKIVDTVRESMLVLDTDLRVVSANDSFYEKFEVAPEETEGRLVYELGNNQWDIPELRRLLEDILPENKVLNDYEVDHEFETIGRRVMRLNGRRIDHIRRILLAIEDITEYRLDEARRTFLLELTDAFHAARRPQDVLDQAATRLCKFLRCQHAGYIEVDVEQNQATILSQHAEDADALDRKHTLSDFGPDLLKSLLESEEVVIDDIHDDSRLDHPAYRKALEHLGSRALACTSRRREDGRVALLAIGYADAHQWKPEETALIRDVAERTWTALEAARADQALRKLNESLEEQVSQRTEVLHLLQDVTRSANEARTIEEATHAALERITQYNGWQVGHVWRLADDDSDEMVDAGIWYVSEKSEEAIRHLKKFQRVCAEMRFSPGQGMVGGVMRSGEPRWVDDIANSDDWWGAGDNEFGLHAAIAFPVTVNGQVVSVIEFFSGHPARREEQFMEIMPDVGIQLGHVIERKRLEKETANAALREQQRIGSDIHDDVGQELTGLRYLAQTHAESLAAQDSPEAAVAERITDRLEAVQKGIRSAIRDLVPVEVDEKGLATALGLLARRVSSDYPVQCAFESKEPVAVQDNLLATHIYRIAQEAVSNAVKHANADTITIRLVEDDNQLRLQVIDDGVGIGPDPQQQQGFGLRNMNYRADLIGARLTIESGKERGTAVTCNIPKRLA